jgi:hypothetical protein
MIPGQYTGTFSNGFTSSGFVGGVDIPLTGRGAEIFPNYEANPTGSGAQWAACSALRANTTVWWAMSEPQGEYFTVGTPSTSGSVCPFLTPAEAQALDIKYDDGRAWSGRIVAPNHYGGGVTCTTFATGAWQLNDKTKSCHLMFLFFQ